MSSTETAPKNSIFSRVSNLPIVAGALGYGFTQYSRVKQSNQFLNLSLSVAESTVAIAASSAVPIVKKLSPSLLSTVEGYACDTLDKLEKVPVIKESPEEIYAKTRVALKHLKDYGIDRIHSAYDANVVPTLDSAMSLTVRAVDFIAGDEEDPEFDKAMKEETSVVRRVGHVSEKLRRRVMDKVAGRLSKLSQASFVGLTRYSDVADHGLNAVAKFVEGNPDNPIVKISKVAYAKGSEHLQSARDVGSRVIPAVTQAIDGVVSHLAVVYDDLRASPRDQLLASVKKHVIISADLLSGWIQSAFGTVIPFHWFDSSEVDHPKDTTDDSKDLMTPVVDPDPPGGDTEARDII